MQDLARGRTLALDLDFLSGVLLQEAFFPAPERSWPGVECFHLRGRVGDGTLTAPFRVTLETGPDGRTVHFADPEGLTPPALAGRGYDLCFPMVAVPLGALRREHERWRTDRRYRPLGTAPFLFPSLEDVWPKHTELLTELFGERSLYALLPERHLWDVPFEDWSEEDWATGHSALWDVPTGEVRWAEGAPTRDEMRRVGRPSSEVFPET